MIKKTISDAITNISTEYIEKAADYTVTKKTHKPVWIKRGTAVACLALLFTLCGFAYIAHIYWGVGSAEHINFEDLTKPFGTVNSEQESQEQEQEIFCVKSEMIKNYDNIYADNSVCVEMNDNNIPSIYFSPGYMVIFTQSNEGGWILSEGEELAIDFSLYDKQNIELEIGYLLNGEYHALFTALGHDFSDTLFIPQDGTYYLCVTNKSSSNAVIKNGIINRK